jgi:peptidylprolyl isomerase
LRRALATLLALVVLPACSGGDKPQASPSPTSSPVIATAKPTFALPTGSPSAQLQRIDLLAGTGIVALPGKVATVHYVGDHYDGREFDTSWGGHPLSFTVGGEEVIPGWDEGIVGMRVGGRRMLVVPPDLAYGPAGDGRGVIGPNETLVFVIDLISVGGQPANAGTGPPQ